MDETAAIGRPRRENAQHGTEDAHNDKADDELGRGRPAVYDNRAVDDGMHCTSIAPRSGVSQDQLGHTDPAARRVSTTKGCAATVPASARWRADWAAKWAATRRRRLGQEPAACNGQRLKSA